MKLDGKNLINTKTIIEDRKMDFQTAKGVSDISPEEKIMQNKVVNTIRSAFESYGFAPLETPIIERYETLAAKFAAGESSDALKEIFKLKDQGNRKLGLRFDLTVPLARYMAANPMLKLPFKRYEMGPVFRDGPIKKGRVRQFWQCDADTIGVKSMLAEAELLAIAEKVFNDLSMDVVIKVNNRMILNGILEEAGIKDKGSAIVAIDKLDKIGKGGVSEELKQRGYSKKQTDALFSYVTEKATLKTLKKIKNEEAQQGIAEMEELFSYLKVMGVSTVKFDVSLARGLAYYTGTVYEAFAKKSSITSSLAAGGRWDDMIGKFSGRDTPAVGIAFGLVPLMEVLKEKEGFQKRTTAQVYVIPINTMTESLKMAKELREAGINVDFAFRKGVSKNLEYAGSVGIPYALILGEDELKKKKVVLRNMTDGTEQVLSVKDVIKRLG